MDTNKPDYLPEQIWRAYCEARQPLADGSPSPIDWKTYRLPVARLLWLRHDAPPDMARTWRRLQAQIQSNGDRLWADSDWRLLWDLLWSLPGSFDVDAYSAVERGREIAPRIAALSYELATALEEYRHLADRHLIDIPKEALGAFEWLETAGLDQPPDLAARFET